MMVGVPIVMSMMIVTVAVPHNGSLLSMTVACQDARRTRRNIAPAPQKRRQWPRVGRTSHHHSGTVLPCTHCGKTHGAEGGREALPWFGMHLLDRGVISAEALLKALDLQQKLQEPFGAVALRLRLMDSRQVMHLINAQR
jgi:hypothetical protein